MMTSPSSGAIGASLLATEPIAREFPWWKYRTFADIGTAQGMYPGGAQARPPADERPGPGASLRAADLRGVRRLRRLSDRLRVQAADFFVDPLPSSDVLVMGRILPDWDLDRKRLLISKAHAALPKDGALIVYEPMIDDERRQNAFGLLMSLNMQVALPGGFAATGAEMRAWLPRCRLP